MSRIAITGMGLLAMSGWVFLAVWSEDRPGRRLLGDALYAYFPLQPGECLVLGTGLGLFGLTLTGLSPTGRRLISLFRRGAAAVPAGVLPGVSPSGKPAGTARPAGVSERRTATAVASHHEIPSVRQPTRDYSAASQTGADHHGI